MRHCGERRGGLYLHGRRRRVLRQRPRPLGYEDLHEAYENAGWSDTDIDKVLRIETPDNAFFNEKGIYNYHGGANVVFDDPDNLNWVISHSKG